MISIKELTILISSAIMLCGLSTTLISCNDEQIVEESTPNTDDDSHSKPEENTENLEKDCEIIIENVKNQNLGLADKDTEVEGYLNAINKDGSWSDVDYASKEEKNWPPIKHLDRMKLMAQAYILPESQFYENNELYSSIVNALNLWLVKKPKCSNWFENVIREPKSLGETLILMRFGKEKVPTELENNMCEHMREVSSSKDPATEPAGANKSDIATHWIYRGVLQKDKPVLDKAVFEVFKSMECVNPGEEGIQHDYSMLQHGPQLYIGGYGHELLKGVINVAVNTAGTGYSLSSAQKYLLYKFVNDTFMESIRGHFQFYNVMGRNVARKGGTDLGGFKFLLEKMKLIDPEHEQDYQTGIRILTGENGAYNGIERNLRHYYMADYMSLSSEKFSANVRLSSKRTYRCENGNDENILSFFMSDGSTAVSISGDEYRNIFPVWDWSHIPGVTNPYMTKIPKVKEWGVYGESDYSGGLSDGKDGLSGFKMVYDKYNNVKMTANKVYFFIEDKIICLGNSISSEMNEQIHTTVEQCRKVGDFYYSKGGDVQKILDDKDINNDTYVNWLWHRDVGYIFPGYDRQVTAVSKKQSGSWGDISKGADNTKTDMNVVSIWFNHGNKPQDGIYDTYEYIIVPNISLENMKVYKSNIEVAKNTSSVQAVSFNNNSIVQAMFYKKGEFEVGDLKVKTDNPCAIMLKKVGERNFQVYFSDPSHKLRSLYVNVTYKGVPRNFSFSDFGGDDIYKGRTHQTNISF